MKLCLPLLFLVFCLPCCGPSKTEKPQTEERKPADEGPKLVGRIATVPTDSRFVLIQRYGKWETESGQILTTRGPEDRTANLRVTGEKLGEFTAADLQSGTVQVGDAVYSHHSLKPVIQLTVPEPPQNKEQTKIE